VSGAISNLTSVTEARVTTFLVVTLASPLLRTLWFFDYLHMISLSRNAKTYLFVAILFTSFVIYKIYYDHKASLALKNSVIVVATIDTIQYTRGITNVEVQFLYNSQIIHSGFGMSDRDVLDSLKKKPMVRLRISKETPTEYIKYIGVYQKPTDNAN